MWLWCGGCPVSKLGIEGEGRCAATSMHWRVCEDRRQERAASCLGLWAWGGCLPCYDVCHSEGGRCLGVLAYVPSLGQRWSP